MKLKMFAHFCLIMFLALLAPAAHAQTFSVIHTFTGTGDGTKPNVGVTIRGGALFGTTYDTTGHSGSGSVYEMTRVGDNWTFNSIYHFSGPDGANPYARVVFGPDGLLYGTTENGGAQYNLGTVFRLTPRLSICKTVFCPWTRTLLTDFGTGQDGVHPSAGDLVWDQGSNIYGTTTGYVDSGTGTVYKLTLSGGVWTKTTLSTSQVGALVGGVIFDNNGNLFGTTCCTGLDNYNGTVYELKNVGGTWLPTTLYTFSGGADGISPKGGLIFDNAGNLYGSTQTGGTGGGGTVFELSPSGSTWTFRVLYSFTADPLDYCGPGQSLTLDAAGNLYGTTLCDGPYGRGTVFKLTNTANGWVYTRLHLFTGSEDGGWPFSQVTIDTDGTLYGTAAVGGYTVCDEGYGCGVVWMIKP